MDAAYLTFLDHGMKGMTMARIGERAGMSHGIVNYYFKTKDDLLGAVIRKGVFVILNEVLTRLRPAKTPRERLSAVIAGNFPEQLFTPDIAQAWVSCFAIIRENPQFARAQKAADNRVRSNLMHALLQITDENTARDLARTIAFLIDGIWLIQARTDTPMTAAEAIRQIEDVVDRRLR